MPNNLLSTIPDYKQTYRAMQMFKDEYMLDFINVEELGMRDEDIDEKVIEQGIVHNIKNFIIVLYHQSEPIQKIIDECVQNLHIPLSA